MEASAAGQDVVGAKADCNAVGEQRLDDLDRGAVVRRAILRHDDCRIADVEVHVARRDDVAVLVGDPAGRGQGHDVEMGVAEPPGGVLVDRLIGLVLGGGRDRDPARRDEAREIVDMAVGMIVHQPGAEPDHALEAEVLEKALLDLITGQGIAVRVEQALLGRQHGARSVAVDGAAFEHPIGLGEVEAGAARQTARRCPGRLRGRTCRPSR